MKDFEMSKTRLLHKADLSRLSQSFISLPFIVSDLFKNNSISCRKLIVIYITIIHRNTNGYVWWSAVVNRI